jgi:hypothetical protein
MLRYSPVMAPSCIALIRSRTIAVCRGRDRWRKRRHSLAQGDHMPNDSDQSTEKALHRATMMHHEPSHRLCVCQCDQYERKSLPLCRDLLLFCNTGRRTGRHDPPGSRMIPGMTANPCVAAYLDEDGPGVLPRKHALRRLYRLKCMLTGTAWLVRVYRRDIREQKICSLVGDCNTSVMVRIGCGWMTGLNNGSSSTSETRHRDDRDEHSGSISSSSAHPSALGRKHQCGSGGDG